MTSFPEEEREDGLEMTFEPRPLTQEGGPVESCECPWCQSLFFGGEFTGEYLC